MISCCKLVRGQTIITDPITISNMGSMAIERKRPIRVGGASGGFTDRQRSILSFAKDNAVDVIVGDWMSEMTMQWHGSAKKELKDKGVSDADRAGLYDPSFMSTFSPALIHLQERGIKVAVNAGASDTEMLAALVAKTIKEQGLSSRLLGSRETRSWTS